MNSTRPNKKTDGIMREDVTWSVAGAFLAAAVWGGQRGGQICIWGVGAQEFRMT